jgi:hypothetical protein
MKTIYVAALAAVLLIGGVCLAEPCDCWKSGSTYNAMFAAGTSETLVGTIVEVTSFGMDECGDGGMQLILKTDGGKVAVHLGPEWYMDHQTVELIAGDKVTVRGARCEFKSKPILLAQAVMKSNEMLVLRSPSGAPAWDAIRQL